jgi:hypothetical protein
MGWFDGWFGGGGGEDRSGPLANLDPKLREFLEKESPVKFNKPEQPQVTQAPPPVATEPTANTKKATVQPGTEAAGATDQKSVPKESLFQDGRYADLWKTYKSREQVEAETKTDSEKLMDVLEGFKDRKLRIGRAAMENCAEEHFEWYECGKNPGLVDRMTSCSAYVKKFERCYKTQSVCPIMSLGRVCSTSSSVPLTRAYLPSPNSGYLRP